MKGMLRNAVAGLLVLAAAAMCCCAPLRIAVVGLEHGHAAGFLQGGALAPAGGALHRSDVQLVGIVEPDRRLFDQYARRFSLPPTLYFSSISAMAAQVHPDAALLFTSTLDHAKAVEECARLGVHVMMEKPLAVRYQDALEMAEAARRGHIHVLVDYETTWYGSNKAVSDLVEQDALGEIRKVIVRDGHRGPKQIHVPPEFFAWLTDPQLNGAGALYDFGCYGADLMTWLMHGEPPQSVMAITQQFQPEIYPLVDDEANVVLTYPSAVAILEASWNWPFDVKNMDVYGRTGYAKTIGRDRVEIRREGEKESRVTAVQAPRAPYDDPLHYLAAVVRGEIAEGDDPSSLQTNLIVSEILDAARQSAQLGRSVRLPLER
jgi:glucose-fructose oxidoreductase